MMYPRMWFSHFGLRLSHSQQVTKRWAMIVQYYYTLGGVCAVLLYPTVQRFCVYANLLYLRLLLEYPRIWFSHFSVRLSLSQTGRKKIGYYWSILYYYYASALTAVYCSLDCDCAIELYPRRACAIVLYSRRCLCHITIPSAVLVIVYSTLGDTCAMYSSARDRYRSILLFTRLCWNRSQKRLATHTLPGCYCHFWVASVWVVPYCHYTFGCVGRGHRKMGCGCSILSWPGCDCHYTVPWASLEDVTGIGATIAILPGLPSVFGKRSQWSTNLHDRLVGRVTANNTLIARFLPLIDRWRDQSTILFATKIKVKN